MKRSAAEKEHYTRGGGKYHIKQIQSRLSTTGGTRQAGLIAVDIVRILRERRSMTDDNLSIVRDGFAASSIDRVQLLIRGGRRARARPWPLGSRTAELRYSTWVQVHQVWRELAQAKNRTRIIEAGARATTTGSARGVISAWLRARHSGRYPCVVKQLFRDRSTQIQPQMRAFAAARARAVRRSPRRA